MARIKILAADGSVFNGDPSLTECTFEGCDDEGTMVYKQIEKPGMTNAGMRALVLDAIRRSYGDDLEDTARRKAALAYAEQYLPV